MAFNSRFFDWFESVPKIAIACGIVTVASALGVLLWNETYKLTGSTELQVAVVGCVILFFAFLSYRIFRNV